jgi:hypothetical protein
MIVRKQLPHRLDVSVDHVEAVHVLQSKAQLLSPLDLPRGVVERVADLRRECSMGAVLHQDPQEVA